MKTKIMQRARGLWLQGAAAAAIATGLAAFAPLAHAQSGTLSNPNNCTSFTGFTWSNSVLSLTCQANTGTTTPPPPACDATQPGSFGWASATGSGAPGTSITGSITRSGGCKGSYTITFGNNAPAGVTISPATSVTFADGSATAQAVSITSATSTPVGTQIAVWLNGWSSTTAGAAAPGIAGTFTATVSNTTAPPPPQPSPSITYSGALTNNLQIVWGTNEQASLPAFQKTDIASYSFTYGGQYGQIILGAVSNNLYGGVADTELAISTTPGDFPGQSSCDVRIPATSVQGQGITAITVWTPGPNHPASSFCLLNQGSTYYLNVRQISANWTSSSPSCTDARGCALRIQPSGVN